MSVRGLRRPRRTNYSLALIRAKLWLILARSFQVHIRQAESTSSSRRTMINRTSLGRAINGDVIDCATGRVLMICLDVIVRRRSERSGCLATIQTIIGCSIKRSRLFRLSTPCVFIGPCELENHIVWSNFCILSKPHTIWLSAEEFFRPPGGLKLVSRSDTCLRIFDASLPDSEYAPPIRFRFRRCRRESV
jgi:hypothetical protein